MILYKLNTQWLISLLRYSLPSGPQNIPRAWFCDRSLSSFLRYVCCCVCALCGYMLTLINLIE